MPSTVETRLSAFGKTAARVQLTPAQELVAERQRIRELLHALPSSPAPGGLDRTQPNGCKLDHNNVINYTGCPDCQTPRREPCH